jgi:hypothetical protein
MIRGIAFLVKGVRANPITTCIGFVEGTSLETLLECFISTSIYRHQWLAQDAPITYLVVDDRTMRKMDGSLNHLNLGGPPISYNYCKNTLLKW